MRSNWTAGIRALARAVLMTGVASLVASLSITGIARAQARQSGACYAGRAHAYPHPSRAG